jgi:OOP family OmpA-OmpF porin
MYARKLKPVLATLLVAGSLVGLGAHAEGLYVGGSMGSQSYPNTLNGNATSGSAISGKVYGGYTLNKNFAVEAGLTELGAVNNAAGQIDSYGTFVDAVGILPLSPQWNLLGRVGVAHMAVNTPTGNDGGNGFKAGLGAEYALTKTVALRGEWERYQLTGFGDKPNADQFTLGVKVGF